MTITASGKQVEVAPGTTVAQLIEQLRVENPRYVTVSVGDEFVDQGSFATRELREGDVVEFIYFMGGGR